MYIIKKCENYSLFKLNNLNGKSLKKLLHFGGGMFGSSIVSMLLGPFNKLAISRWVGVSSVPIYEIAFNGSMQIRSLIEAIFRAISPEISRLSASHDEESKGRMRDINKRAVKIIWIFGTPLWIGILIFATPLLRIWLGARFVEALPLVFQILMVSTFIGLLGVPAFYILMGLGKTKQIFLGNVLQSGINALLVTLMIVISVDMSINYIAVAVLFGVFGANIYLIMQKNKILRKTSYEIHANGS
jgi:O-antigen/teichoic acid export membrane protein